MAQGIHRLGNRAPWGYTETKDCKYIPNADADMVKRIFSMRMEGMPAQEIADRLNAEGIKNKFGRKFLDNYILGIIHNEFYIGTRILQKQPHLNYLTKKPDPMIPYTTRVIENDHEPLVSKEVWDACQKVQTTPKRKKGYKFKCKIENGGTGHRLITKRNSHYLRGHLFCAECGAPLRRIVSRKRPAWQCTDHIMHNGCANKKYLYEDQIEKTLNTEEIQNGKNGYFSSNGIFAIK